MSSQLWCRVEPVLSRPGPPCASHCAHGDRSRKHSHIHGSEVAVEWCKDYEICVVYDLLLILPHITSAIQAIDLT